MVDEKLWEGAAAAGWQLHQISRNYIYTAPNGTRYTTKKEAKLHLVRRHLFSCCRARSLRNEWLVLGEGLKLGSLVRVAVFQPKLTTNPSPVPNPRRTWAAKKPFFGKERFARLRSSPQVGVYCPSYLSLSVVYIDGHPPVGALLTPRSYPPF